MSIETAFILIMVMLFGVAFILSLEYRGCKYAKSLGTYKKEPQTSSNKV